MSKSVDYIFYSEKYKDRLKDIVKHCNIGLVIDEQPCDATHYHYIDGMYVKDIEFVDDHKVDCKKLIGNEWVHHSLFLSQAYHIMPLDLIKYHHEKLN